MTARDETAVVLGCTVVAGLLYVATMAGNSLRTDELIMLITARRPILESLLQQEDYSAPLYQLLLRFFVHNDHPPVWVIRAPAVIFAVLCLPAAWWLGRSLFGRRTGLLTLPLLALNAVFLFHARDGRPYSLFVLLSILSMGCFWRLLLRGGAWNWFSYLTSTVALCWSQYYGFLCLPAQALFAILQFAFQRDAQRSSLRGLYAVTVASLLAIPAFWLASRYILAGVPAMTDDWLQRPKLLQLLTGWHVIELFRSIAFGPLWMYASVALFWQKAPFCRRDVALNPASWWNQHRSPLFCLLWVGFGLYLPLAVSWLIHPVYRVSYGIPIIVPVVMLTMAGLQRMRNVWTVLCVAMIVVAVFSSHTFLAWRGFPEVVAWLKDNDVRTPVSVADWGYCEHWKNPEQFGLIYYGLPADRIRLLRLNFPYGPGLRAGENLPNDRPSIVVGHVQFQKTLLSYLQEHHRQFETHYFDTLFLFFVKPMQLNATEEREY